MMVGGLIMIIFGVTVTFFLIETNPVGRAGMTEDQKLDLLIAEQVNSDYRTLSGILIGIGFLLVLISFGARRKRGSNAKKTEKKYTT